MRSRNALVGYFVLSFVIAWTGVLAVARTDERYLMFVAMLLGPSLASIGLTLATGGVHGLRDLGRSLRRLRVGARWYAALLLAPVLLVGVLAVMSRVSATFRPDLVAGAPVGGVLTYAAIAGLGAGFFEELGWTGFATPRLLARGSWFGAGLVLGLLWGVWHLLPDYLARTEHGPLWVSHAVEWVVALTAFRIVMTWVYSHTRSLALAMLMHASFTGSQALLWPGGTSLAGEVIWYGVFAITLWVVVGAGTYETPPDRLIAH